MYCFGCDTEIVSYSKLKVEGERKKQPYCKDCAERVIQIEKGLF